MFKGLKELKYIDVVVYFFFYLSFRNSDNGVVADRDRSSPLYGTDIDNRDGRSGVSVLAGVTNFFFFSKTSDSRGRKVKVDLLPSSIEICGAFPLLPLCAIMAWTGNAFPV